MKEINVTIGQWYVVEGAAGDTITNPSTGRAIATVEEGKQASFYATSAVVVASSDSVQVHRANFKSAPAKLMALGLLGGGSSTGGLPSGYIAAEFIQNTGQQSFETEQTEENVTEYRLDFQFISSTNNYQSPFANTANATAGITGTKILLIQEASGWHMDLRNTQSTWGYQIYGVGYDKTRTVVIVNENEAYFGKTKATKKSNSLNSNNSNHFYLFSRLIPNPTSGIFRIYRLSFTEGEHLSSDIIPVLSINGEPVFYDIVRKKAYKTQASIPAIAGFTLPQAINLRKLPATGGTLTISLPTGYESDEGVAAALQTARANGWTLTIQTYTPETAGAAASTFALRRIWVRRTQNDNGAYVDASGSHWLVEWCVDMLTPDGSTPDAHGYELFRSVEAAVAYWELEPWVDPEAEQMMQEELLTNSTTNEHE